MEQKTFCTLFPEATNVHLVKDVGQIPYIMGARYGYHASLAAHGLKEEYPYLSDEVCGLNYQRVRRGKVMKGIDTGVLVFLLARSKKIDVLNLYHATTATKVYSILYKLLNRKGFLFLKLDTDVEHEKQQRAKIRTGSQLVNLARKALNRKFAASIDLASAETDEATQLVGENAPELKSKLLTIPNGVDTDYLFQQHAVPPYEEKENLIITVGRLGTFQKNTEMLLKALSQTNLQGWKVCLIGPVDPDFQSIKDSFYRTNPGLESQVTFVGSVNDRKEIARWYSRAKVFVLTSRFEGFPLVFPEALVYGNFLITTDVSSARAVIENEEFGEVVSIDDAAGLSRAIHKIITTGRYNENLFSRITTYAESKYSWASILKPLDKLIKSGDTSC